VIRLFVVFVVAGAAAIAGFFSRRLRDAPTQSAFAVPTQLDRTDFVQPTAPWLVAVFTSATCNTCADIETKARALESQSVAVHVAEFGSQRALHERYHIDAVPTLLIANSDGVVRQSFVGAVTATDLWAALARVRELTP
jgi:hypothetical protein